MHDHSRFQRDIDDVTGVSLSLSLLLTKVTHAQYRKRFRASYNIGSASALPIITRKAKRHNWLCSAEVKFELKEKNSSEEDFSCPSWFNWRVLSDTAIQQGFLAFLKQYWFFLLVYILYMDRPFIQKSCQTCASFRRERWLKKPCYFLSTSFLSESFWIVQRLSHNKYHLLKLGSRCFARISTMTHTSSWSELRHPAMFHLCMFSLGWTCKWRLVTNTSHWILKSFCRVWIESGDAIMSDRGFTISHWATLAKKLYILIVQHSPRVMSRRMNLSPLVRFVYRNFVSVRTIPSKSMSVLFFFDECELTAGTDNASWAVFCFVFSSNPESHSSEKKRKEIEFVHFSSESFLCQVLMKSRIMFWRLSTRLQMLNMVLFSFSFLTTKTTKTDKDPVKILWKSLLQGHFNFVVESCDVC